MNMGCERVLVVDLDGTLIKTDSLIESGLDFLHRDLKSLPSLAGWLLEGKAKLKEKLAEYSRLNFDTLPYNEDVLALINDAKGEQRKVVLASACDRAVAEGVALHLGCFDEVISSDGETNLSAENKRDELIRRYGEKGFDYIGNSRDDLVVWQSARYAILIDTPAGVSSQARIQGNVVAEYSADHSSPKALMKAMRPHQWAKNMLIFVPLFVSHMFDFASALIGIAAFVCFCLVASGTYLINDLLDIQDDRKHPSKCRRPFAAGTLDALTGIKWAVGLVLGGVLLAILALPYMYLLILTFYLIVTLLYSFSFKKVVALDVIILTVLYTIRIVAGAVALSLEMTFWILTFSLFIFLSLALVKRYSELYDARQKGQNEQSAGRGYYPSDLEMIAQMGVANGFLSILFFALYLNDATTIALYSSPKVLWLICPVLMYWISRLWLITHRGEMHDDPVVFAIKDKVSLLTLGLIGTIFIAAL